MSGHKLRKEKNCLNCNAEVAGRFCQVCGQENIEPDENFWQLCVHFVADLFHYDGKFFRTIRFLLFKPAFVTKEYIRGRRASYLHPIRLYIFTSAVFFIFFFTFIANNEDTDQFSEAIAQREKLSSQLDKLEAAYTAKLAEVKDLSEKKELETKLLRIEEAMQVLDNDSTKNLSSVEDVIKEMNNGKWGIDVSKAEANKSPVAIDISNKGDSSFNFFGKHSLPLTTELYRQQQESLPKKSRDGWFSSWFTEKQIEINAAYKKDPQSFFKHVTENFLHALPKMLFISLPLVAFLFHMMYLRKKHKHHLYVHQGVFTIHIYVMIFLILLFIYGLNALEAVSKWSLFGFMANILSLAILYHIYKSMRNFYEQGRAKTILKFLIVMLLTSLLLIILMIIFFFNSAISIHV